DDTEDQRGAPEEAPQAEVAGLLRRAVGHQARLWRARVEIGRCHDSGPVHLVSYRPPAGPLDASDDFVRDTSSKEDEGRSKGGWDGTAGRALRGRRQGRRKAPAVLLAALRLGDRRGQPDELRDGPA